MPLTLNPEDEDELNGTPNYEQLLRKQLYAPSPAQDTSFDLGQLGATLAQSANQLGTIGGRTADSSQLKNFADTMTKYKQNQQANLLAQNEKRQDILTKLATLKDNNAQRQNSLAQASSDKEAQRDFLSAQENQRFKHEKALLGLKGSQARDLLGDKMAGIGTAGVGVDGQPPAKLSVAQTAVDKNFAKDYNDYVAQGGFAEAAKGLSKVRNVANELRKDDSITGPIAGMTPDWVRSFTNPHAIDVRENLEDVVQRSMRQVMGAQFTEAEGKRLLARAYNPSLPAAVNAQRVEALADSLEKAAKAKMDAIKYYETNGTLAGYQGSTEIPNLDAIAEDAGLNKPVPRIGKPEEDEAIAGEMPVSRPAGGPKVGDVRKGYQFIGGNPADKNSWKKVQ